MTEHRTRAAYEYARMIYAERGIDCDAAIERVNRVAVSMHSWQGDDLIGFDGLGELTGGIAATGNYPGRARNGEELRRDMEQAIALIPGPVKINLHACHAELNGEKVDRDAYTVRHYQHWIEWAQEKGLGLDFNPTFFSHPKMDGNFSLASDDEGTRRFWIEHGKRCREIGQEFGKRLGQPCVVNFWMPDGYKDIPADTLAPRERMLRALDEIFADEMSPAFIREALESKLFGLGLESYTVASHEFSLGYAMTRRKLYCLDAGHFHPTERIGDKISAVLQYLDGVLLHISRGVRWDSDHVVIWNDDLQNTMNEVFHNSYEERVYLGQDYFDASINRIACWVIGMRNTRKAMLKAALDPMKPIREAEAIGNYTARLALLEETKSLPFSAVWDFYCLCEGVPEGDRWLAEIERYERDVLSGR